jgi:hypothetical protein
MASLSGRCGQTRCQSRRRSSGTVRGSSSAARSRSGSSPDDDLAQRCEMGVGQHGERDMAVPAAPSAAAGGRSIPEGAMARRPSRGADLVLVEADLALGRLEAGLDRPAAAGYLHELGKGRAVASMGEIEGEIARVGEAAADQEPPLPAGRRVAAISSVSPVVEPRALRPVAGSGGARPSPAPGLSEFPCAGHDDGKEGAHAWHAAKHLLSLTSC